jgi:hypothetical protein
LFFTNSLSFKVNIDKPMADLKKVLANPWSRQTIVKKEVQVAGWKPNGKCKLKQTARTCEISK